MALPASPFQGSHLDWIQPRAPAGFAASALGCPAPRFQRFNSRSNSLVDTLSIQLLQATSSGAASIDPPVGPGRRTGPLADPNYMCGHKKLRMHTSWMDKNNKATDYSAQPAATTKLKCETVTTPAEPGRQLSAVSKIMILNEFRFSLKKLC